jgi:hypothetical protein
MRRTIVVSLAVLMIVVACASAASAARTRAYRGETSAGTKIGFRIRVADDGRMSMKGLRFRADLLCDDASTIRFWSFWQFGGVGERLDGRRLTFDEAYGSEAMHVAGVFRGRGASGTFEDTMAWLTDDEQAQLCTTGELTWEAHRVPRDRFGDAPQRAEVVYHSDDVTVYRGSRAA